MQWIPQELNWGEILLLGPYQLDQEHTVFQNYHLISFQKSFSCDGVFILGSKTEEYYSIPSSKVPWTINAKIDVMHAQIFDGVMFFGDRHVSRDWIPLCSRTTLQHFEFGVSLAERWKQPSF